MKTFTLILNLFLASNAFAQATDSIETRFPGYTPTILNSTAEVDQAFASLDKHFRKFNVWTLTVGTQCTQRAQLWTYDLEQTKQIKAEKVFVFYTHAFKRDYRKAHGEDFQWWFHVAPYLLAKNSNGETEERVLDKEFSDRSLTMKEWTDLFIESKEKCIENVPYANFEGDVSATGASYNKNAHCYIVRAPMYDMYPADVDARERGERPEMSWDQRQVKFALRALTSSARKVYETRVGLRSEEN